MNYLLSRFKTPSALGFLAFFVLFAVCMVYVFYPVLPLEWVTQSPDYPKYYPVWVRTQYIEALLTGKESFVPLTLLNYVGTPLMRQELNFIIPCLLAALAITYYLRTQNVSRMAAYGGGLFFGFSGYSLTLFCAGHGGYFDLIAYGLFALGLINRCFQKRDLFYFAMLGATVMWAEIHQPDVWMLFMAVTGAYGLWRTVREWRETREVAFLLRVYPRFLVTLLVIALIGARQIRVALTDTLAAREKQVTEVSAALKSAGQQESAKPEAQSDRDRWIFMTNWSLPPEDMLEFIVPGIFGNDSFQTPYPYWGRLGQPYGFQKGRMMPNYRQHTVYLGVVSVLFGLFACWCWLATRKRATAEVELMPSDAAAPDFRDVPFWWGVAVIGTLCALGRYTPVYQAVYHLPFMSYFRAPVKYHHVVEIACAILAGFGIEYFLQGTPQVASVRRRFVYLCGAVIVGLLTGLFVLQLNGVPLEQYIAGLGFGQLATPLHEYAVSNILRSVVLVAIVIACFVWAGRKSCTARTLFCCAGLAVALNTMDMAEVARRHVVPLDVGPHHEANAVVKAMAARTGGRPANVMNYVTSNAGFQDWFSTALDLHGFSNMAPSEDRAAPRAVLFESLKNDPLRYWQITGARFVILPRKSIEPLLRQGVLSAVCDFELGNGTVRSAQPSEKSLTLAEVTAFPALPALYADWTGPVAADQQLAALKEGKEAKPVADIAPSAGAVGASAKSVQLDQMRKMPSVLATRGRIEAPQASLLVFNEPFSADLEALLDGRPVRVGQANAMWAAIEVPQGSHEVVLRMKPAFGMNAVSIMLSLALVGWFFARHRPRPNN